MRVIGIVSAFESRVHVIGLMQGKQTRTRAASSTDVTRSKFSHIRMNGLVFKTDNFYEQH